VIGLIGSLLLFVGAFTPLISMPVVGSVTYFQNGRGDGVIMIVLSAISLAVVLMRRYQWLWFTGATALGVLSFTYLHLQAAMTSAASSMNSDLAGNPFKGLGEAMIQSVQIQWGFAVLVIAAVLLVGSAAIPQRHPVELGVKDGRWNRVIFPMLSVILFGVIFTVSFAYTQHEKAVAIALAKQKVDAALKQQQADQAEQARQQAAQDAEESEKASAIYKVKLLKWGWSKDSNEFAAYLVGTARNDSSRTMDYLQIKFDLLDAQNNKVGTAEDSIASLAPGETWKFRAMAMASGVARARCTGFEGRAE
jgi:hypothetical protein